MFKSKEIFTSVFHFIIKINLVYNIAICCLTFQKKRFLCACVCLCLSIYTCVQVSMESRRDFCILKVKLRVVVSCLMWVLGTELRTSARAV